MANKELLEQLEKAGVRISGNTIATSDLLAAMPILGSAAKYSPPDWLSATDMGFTIPVEYRAAIETEFDSLGRMPNPESFRFARYGKYNNEAGQLVLLEGVIYQFAQRYNPRNIKYAYKLFSNGAVISQNTCRSVLEAESYCNKAAQDKIAHLHG